MWTVVSKRPNLPQQAAASRPRWSRTALAGSNTSARPTTPLLADSLLCELLATVLVTTLNIRGLGVEGTLLGGARPGPGGPAALLEELAELPDELDHAKEVVMLILNMRLVRVPELRVAAVRSGKEERLVGEVVRELPKRR